MDSKDNKTSKKGLSLVIPGMPANNKEYHEYLKKLYPQQYEEYLKKQEQKQ